MGAYPRRLHGHTRYHCPTPLPADPMRRYCMHRLCLAYPHRQDGGRAHKPAAVPATSRLIILRHCPPWPLWYWHGRHAPPYTPTISPSRANNGHHCAPLPPSALHIMATRPNPPRCPGLLPAWPDPPFPWACRLPYPADIPPPWCRRP